jgi:hypothetical protein
MDATLIAERRAQYLPRNYRIISHRTQRRILHIEDVLEIGKIRFELWDYARGSGAKASVEAYLDVHTVRLLASELAAGRLDDMDGHQEMGGGVAGGEVLSRILVTENADARNPIRITIRNGPGVRQAGGLISPAKGQPQVSVSVLLSRFDARRMGLAILDHLQAWAAQTYASRIASGTWQAEETAEGAHSPMPPEPALRYANGEQVSDNPAEAQAYLGFLGVQGQPPQDVEALRVWVRESVRQDRPAKSDSGPE